MRSGFAVLPGSKGCGERISIPCSVRKQRTWQVLGSKGQELDIAENAELLGAQAPGQLSNRTCSDSRRVLSVHCPI